MAKSAQYNNLRLFFTTIGDFTGLEKNWHGSQVQQHYGAKISWHTTPKSRRFVNTNSIKNG